MSKIVELPDRGVIKQEAFDWLILLDGDDALSKEDLAELKEWLDRSPVHRETLISLNTFWANNVLTQLMVPLEKPTSSAAGSFSRHSNRWFGGIFTLALGIASVFAFMILIPAGWFETDPVDLQNRVYVTAVGQQETFSLDDGSVLTMNTNSQLEVNYSQSYRIIRLLRGEAHFDVAKNRNRPFRVYAGDNRVEAIGTAFSVYLKPDNVDVLVVEGRVSVSSLDASFATDDRKLSGLHEPIAAASNARSIDLFLGGETIQRGVLDAGQRLLLHNSIQPTLAEAEENSELSTIESVTPEELERLAAWRNGYLAFSGESLADVVKEISRFTTVKIEIENPELKEIEIGGMVLLGELDDMLDALEANFGLEVTRLSYNHVQISSSNE